MRWTQITIGRITDDIRKIHENHPDADEDLKNLMKDVGRYIDGTLGSEHEPSVRLRTFGTKRSLANY